MAAIKEVLNKFKVVGVDLAAVIDMEGTRIESYSRGNLDVDAVCSAATHGLRLSEALGKHTGQGSSRQTLLEYETGTILLEPLNDDAMFLVVSADPASIGRIRFLSKKYHEELLGALKQPDPH